MEAFNLKVPFLLSLLVHAAIFSLAARPLFTERRHDAIVVQLLSSDKEPPATIAEEKKDKLTEVPVRRAPVLRRERVVRLEDAVPPPRPVPESAPAAKAEPPATVEEVNLPQMKVPNPEAASSEGTLQPPLASLRPGAGDPAKAGAVSATGRGSATGDAKSTVSLRDALSNLKLAVRSRVAPRYPESAKRSGAQGSNLVKVRVVANGEIGEALIVESAGHPALDQAAVDAARRWKFELPRENDAIVSVWVLIPFEFRLQ